MLTWPFNSRVKFSSLDTSMGQTSRKHIYIIFTPLNPTFITGVYGGIHYLFYFCSKHSITQTCLFKYIENFATKIWKFSDNLFFLFFQTSAHKIDCGYLLEPPRRGGCNEYPQSMFLSRNKKNNVYPCKPQFYFIKVAFKGVKII